MVNLERANLIIREYSYTPTALARAGDRLRSLHSADPPHAPRRLRFILRSVPPPVARGREGYAPVPARRAVQRHRPPFPRRGISTINNG